MDAGSQLYINRIRDGNYSGKDCDFVDIYGLDFMRLSKVLLTLNDGTSGTAVRLYGALDTSFQNLKGFADFSDIGKGKYFFVVSGNYFSLDDFYSTNKLYDALHVDNIGHFVSEDAMTVLHTKPYSFFFDLQHRGVLAKNNHTLAYMLFDISDFLSFLVNIGALATGMKEALVEDVGRGYVQLKFNDGFWSNFSICRFLASTKKNEREQ